MHFPQIPPILQRDVMRWRGDDRAVVLYRHFEPILLALAEDIHAREAFEEVALLLDLCDARATRIAERGLDLRIACELGPDVPMPVLCAVLPVSRVPSLDSPMATEAAELLAADRDREIILAIVTDGVVFVVYANFSTVRADTLGEPQWSLPGPVYAVACDAGGAWALPFPPRPRRARVRDRAFWTHGD